MGEILPRNVIISLLLVFFVFTAGIFMITEIYGGLGQSTPDSVTSLASNLSIANTSINQLAESTSDSFNQEKQQGFVSGACTSLLGDDNFFCAGLQTLGSFTSAPEKMKLTINAFNQSFPISIPQWVFTTITAVLVTIVVFVGVSAYRRYQS
jgi:hypothetical protein